MTNGQLDLSRLAIDRTSTDDSSAASTAPPRKWLTRYLIPGTILLGFAGLLIAATGSQLFPSQSVEVIPVIVQRGISQQTGAPLFQAPGWIEPRPTSINVPALAAGVIEELLVVEGQSVKKGEPIAKLLSIDAEIAAKKAAANLAQMDGDLNRALAEHRAAKIRLEKPIHLQVQLADANSRLAQSQTELAKLPFLIESAKANLEYAEQSVKGKRAAGKSIPGVVLQKAESELADADATLRELQHRKPNLTNETHALQQKVTALQSQLALLVEETRQLEEAAAKVQSATARQDTAKLQLQKANLELERNTIRSPIDGRILRLVASPGMRVMGLETTAGQASSSVVEMYDPQRLQVRAAVRLEDVPLVQPGQLVDIETASINETIKGRVLQPNSTADVQKNTLEVKVEILQPPDKVRPEMLVTTTFLAPENTDTTAKDIESDRIFVPSQLIQNNGESQTIWTVDVNGYAREKAIVVGKTVNGPLTEIIEGLAVTDKLITSELSNLSEGSLVKVVGENRTLGK